MNRTHPLPLFTIPSLIYYDIFYVLSVLTDFGVCLRIRALDMAKGFMVQLRLKARGEAYWVSTTPNPRSY